MRTCTSGIGPRPLFFENTDVMSINLKEIKHKAACKQIVCSSTQPRPLACSQTANFAVSGHVAYGNEGNETHVRYQFEYVCFNEIEGIEHMHIMQMC